MNELEDICERLLNYFGIDSPGDQFPPLLGDDLEMDQELFALLKEMKQIMIEIEEDDDEY